MAFKFVCLGHNGIPRWEENRPNRCLGQPVAGLAGGAKDGVWTGGRSPFWVYILYIYMCVWNPWNQRESADFLSRAAQEAHRAVPNETLYADLRIRSLISCTYLLEF